MSKSPEISTDAFLYTQFGVGTQYGTLCTTKSRAISLGLSVSSSTFYENNQLLPKNVIMGPTASTMNIQMDIYLNNTAFIINKSIYSVNSYLILKQLLSFVFQMLEQYHMIDLVLFQDFLQFLLFVLVYKRL
jgi:hypothetical protein